MNIGKNNKNISQFATLPTQISSKNSVKINLDSNNEINQLFTAPFKHYKHLSQFGSSSEPIKYCNANKQKMNFEYDKIINLQKEICSLKNELKPNDNESKQQGDDVSFMKKQIVELLVDKEKLSKKCKDLNEIIRELKEKNTKLIIENIKYEEQSQSNQSCANQNNKINALRIECQQIKNDTNDYKMHLADELKQRQSIINEDMTKIYNASKQIVASQKKLEQAYNKEVILRRKYFNQIQELKGNIRVYCRIRPLLKNEIENKHTQKVNSIDKFTLNITKEDDRKISKKTFEFDQVFSAQSTQDEVFNEVKSVITSVLDGYNVCIFAYGQTGSGKTYTMEGINYRAIKELFNEIKQRQNYYKYTLHLNMIEIYNEKIKDLLNQNTINHFEKDLKLKAQTAYLQIRGGGNNDSGVRIDGLSQFPCNTIDDVYRALNIGYKSRSFGVTDLNQHSSRSHCILTINVNGIHHTTGNEYVSKLNLIDLAGSERVKVSNAAGSALKEAQCINKSLSCLGNVLESIKSKKQHIPYRDSKLTFLLKDSIGQSAKTLMMVNVSSCSKDVNETMTSLMFASRVRNVSLGKSVKNKEKRRRSSVSSASSIW